MAPISKRRRTKSADGCNHPDSAAAPPPVDPPVAVAIDKVVGAFVAQKQLDGFLSGGKTWDVRTCPPPKVVKPGKDIFFCVDKGHANTNGHKVLHAACRAEFAQSRRVAFQELQDKRQAHCLGL